jgi:hypothetical protein
VPEPWPCQLRPLVKVAGSWLKRQREKARKRREKAQRKQRKRALKEINISDLEKW